MAPFGNDPLKIERYRSFWARGEAKRPLVGFTFIGWFPLGEFAAAKEWGTDRYLTPEMLNPEVFLGDHLRMCREGEIVDDDLIRGACPGQVAIPWLPATLGCQLRVLPQNVLGDERRLSWNEALATRLDQENPWLAKYLEFAEALARASDGGFPVGNSPELGPTDLHGVLRGHTESILDLADEPEKSERLLCRMGEVFCEFVREIWKRTPLFHDGYFDPQYSLWAAGPIARLQEDATANYSPRLYRRFVQPVDRMMARQFACSFIHLHSTSMFLLDAILEIEEIRCFEINQDALGPPVAAMIPHFRKVQDAGRPLLVRGSFTPDELRLLMDSLEPRGLFLNIMVNEMKEIEALRPLVGM
jgi:hypothetical protein